MKNERLLRLNHLMTMADGWIDELAKTQEAERLREAHRNLRNYFKEAGKSGDLTLIVTAEKAMLNNELTHHANSKSMVASLNAALAELTAIERLLAIVDDRHEYSRIDQAHLLPRNREKGLPLDEARQAFRSHHARLGNLEKARLSGDEKAIIEARKDNMLIANRHYAQRQARTLGIPEV
jgi:hypothetical protein